MAGWTIQAAGKPRNAARSARFAAARRLDFDGFNNIGDRDFPPLLESRLSPEYVGFPQLGKRESFGFADHIFERVACKQGAEPLVILAAQAGVRIAELNHTVEPPRSPEDRRVEASGVVRRSHDDDPVLASNPIQAIEQHLEAR